MTTVLQQYLDGTGTDTTIDEFMTRSAWKVSDEEFAALKPLLQKVMLKSASENKPLDFFVATRDAGLFAFVLSLAKHVDVVEWMLAPSPGPDRLEAIVELMYDHGLELPEKIVRKHFSDDALDECGWGNRAEELRCGFIAD